MLNRFLLPALTLVGTAFAQPDGSCFGCQIGSYCDGSDGDLSYSSATYYLADRWLELFGNSSLLEPEMGRAICDADWCQVLSNYAGTARDYTYEQARLAVGHVKSGAVDGCSKYRQQFIDTGNPDTSENYLRFETTSSYYSAGYGDDGSLQTLIDFYGGPGNAYDGPFYGSFAD